MGKNDLLSEKEVLKKLAKEEKNKKKNKKARRDAWTAVAILATIMLIAVGLSFYKSSNIEIKEYSGRSSAKEHERRETTRNVIIGLGVACTGILIVALVNRSKNKDVSISKEEMQRIEQRKLDAARERVEEARKNRLNEELNATVSRTNRGSTHSIMEGHKGSISDSGNMSTMDMEDREAYLERRKREYQYYLEHDDDESIGEDDFEDEKLSKNGTSRGGIKKFWNKKTITYGIAALVAVIVIVIVIMIFL